MKRILLSLVFILFPTMVDACGGSSGSRLGLFNLHRSATATTTVRVQTTSRVAIPAVVVPANVLPAVPQSTLPPQRTTVIRVSAPTGGGCANGQCAFPGIFGRR